MLFIGGLFAAVVGWILLSPQSLTPEEWWDWHVKPHLQKSAEAEVHRYYVPIRAAPLRCGGGTLREVGR